jgi:hypothetical protein
MGLRKGKTYVRKPYGNNQLYKWSPQPTDKKINKSTGNPKYFCNAKPNSQGEDWITTYSYEIIVEGGTQKRIAYVECDYVK